MFFLGNLLGLIDAYIWGGCTGPADDKDFRNYHRKSMASYVRERLIELLGNIDEDHDMFGPLIDGVLQMPRSSRDGRKLTWAKLIRKISKSVVNDPHNDKSCWFVPANKEDGYFDVKLSKDGSRTKYRATRLLLSLVDPDAGYRAAADRDQTVHCAHRCGRGRALREGGLVCINPFHAVLVASKLNQDHKGCKYGCRKLCPHDPKCLWTWHDTGRRKRCFNRSELPAVCEHRRKCTHISETVLELRGPDDG